MYLNVTLVTVKFETVVCMNSSAFVKSVIGTKGKMLLVFSSSCGEFQLTSGS